MRWINVPGADLVLRWALRLCNRQQRMQDNTAKEHGERGPEAPLLLVVDDDAAVLGSLKFCLEIDGFEVKAYASGEALLNEIAPPSSVCLVLGYHLPDMTGLELLAKLRSQGVELPAVLITGHPGLALRRQAALAGIAIVEKPVLGNALTDAIRGAIGGRIPGAAP